MITIKFYRDLKKKSVTRENKDNRDLLNAVDFWSWKTLVVFITELLFLK